SGVTHEVHAPALVRPRGHGHRDPGLRPAHAAAPPLADQQAPIADEALDALVVHRPALAPQPPRQPRAAPARPRLGQRAKAREEAGIHDAARLVLQERAVDAEVAAGTTLGELVRTRHSVTRVRRSALVTTLFPARP